MAFTFNFGSNAATQASTFGSASKPSFSFGSTNTATTSSAGFGGFGTTTTPSGFGGFGATATSTATPFGGLGQPASTAPSLFGNTGFGAATSKPATGFGTGTGTGFGLNTFGTGNTFGAGSTFGSTAPTFGANTLSSNTFGGGSTFGTGTNFGTSFGSKPATGFGGFGTGLGTGLGTAPAFGQQPQQQQQGAAAGPSTPHEALVAAVFNCCVFGDERDQVLAKWNLLQAQWGGGQAYYSRNAPPLELSSANPLCRFKAVGYSRLSAHDDSDGLVAMSFNKSEQEVKTNQQVLVSSLAGLLGNRPNLTVNVESVKSVGENKCQVTIYVVDAASGGARISASELTNFLNGASAKPGLTSAGCTSVTSSAKPSPQLLTHYLNTPPPGMDMRLWKQAQADNPDPDNYIPVPIIGFSEIKYRSQCQVEEARLQAEWLRRAQETVTSLKEQSAAADAKLAALRDTSNALKHTLLQVIARQEVTGRVGAALTPEEEAVKARLHELNSQLAAPPLYNGRLNELLSAVRLQKSACSGTTQERYQLDPDAQEDLKQFLSMQQKGMAHLLETAREDLATLNTIAEGMSRMVRS